MAPVASQSIDGVTAYVQSDSLEDAREICADGSYFPNYLNILIGVTSNMHRQPSCICSYFLSHIYLC